MNFRFITQLFCVLFFSFSSKIIFAQQKIDQVIPNEEKRKVEKARKLYNDLKVYEGEKILKDLVKEHPNDYYYHEALVQIQRQVLRKIKVASGELEKVAPSTEVADSTMDEFGMPIVKDTTQKAKKVVAILTDFGLDRNGNGVVSKFVKEEKNDFDAPVLTEAVVTIDSSLLVSEDSLDVQERKISREERQRKKQLKYLESLAQIPYDSYKYDLIQNCRKATRLLNTVDSASYYLREFFVDTLDFDILASEEAKEVFEEGLSEFYSKNIPAAAKLFEKAIELYPRYYSALIYLGDTYFLMNKDTAAIRQYHKATLVNPDLPEAFEKIANAFYARGKYSDAASQIIEAIMVYPQDQYFTFLKRIVSKTGKDFDLQWKRREVFPLTTAHVFEEIIAEEKTPWWHYQAAKSDVYSYFDTAGFVRPNDKTNEQYLEIYGWKRMLNNSGKQHFQFARAMDKMGLLECYVFITLFHNDIYAQFKDYVKNNPEKVEKYFYVLINWDDKKFDKIKKEVGLISSSSEKKKTN